MDSTQSSLYSILAGAGAALGLWWSWWRIADEPRRFVGRSIQARRDILIPAAFSLLTGSLLGSRIAFVFLHWSHYQFHTMEIGRFWEGGLDWTGAPLGAGIFFLIYVGWKGISPVEILEDLSPLWTVLVTAVWLGSGMEGLFVGSPIQSVSWLPATLDEMGSASTRLPLAWIGAVATVLVGSLVDWFSLHQKARVFHFGYLFMFQMGLLLFFSFIRTDPVAPLAGIASDRLAAGIYLGAALVILIVLRFLRAVHTR